MGSINDRVDLSNKSQCERAESANGFPRNTPSITIVTPITDASVILPGRSLYIQKPVTRAAGIVTMIVNMPHALSLKALTTTIATLARMATMMNNVAIDVVIPNSGLILLRAILARDNPSYRTDASRIAKSYTAPARHAPITIQMNPVA